MLTIHATHACSLAQRAARRKQADRYACKPPAQVNRPGMRQYGLLQDSSFLQSQHLLGVMRLAPTPRFCFLSAFNWPVV